MESKNFKVVSLDGRRRKEGTKPKVPLRNGMDGRVGMCSILGRRRRKGEQTGEIKEKWISMAVSRTRFAFGERGRRKDSDAVERGTFVKMDVGRRTGFVYWIAITCAGGGSLMLSRMCRGKSLNRQTTKWDWHWPFFERFCCFLTLSTTLSQLQLVNMSLSFEYLKKCTISLLSGVYQSDSSSMHISRPRDIWPSSDTDTNYQTILAEYYYTHSE